MPHCVVGQMFSIVSKDWTATFFRIQQSKCLALALTYLLFTSLPFPVSRKNIPAITLRPCAVHISNIPRGLLPPLFILCQHLYNAPCLATWLFFLDSETWKMMIMVLQNIRKYLPSDILRTWILESLWVGGTQWRSWLRHCATSRKVAGSIPNGVTGHNPSSHTVTLGLIQSLTEMSTRNISWGVKAAGAYVWQPSHFHVPIVFKSGSLNLLEPSGPVQDCNVIALPLP